jgi:hypothetical protein
MMTCDFCAVGTEFLNIIQLSCRLQSFMLFWRRYLWNQSGNILFAEDVALTANCKSELRQRVVTVGLSESPLTSPCIRQ